MLFFVYSMMISAAGSTFSEYYGVNGNIGRAIMIIASLATVLLGLNKLVQIIGYISPVLLVTIVIGVISIASNPEGIAQADASLQTITVHTNFSNWVISGLMYGAYTVTGVVPYLADIGKSTSTMISIIYPISGYAGLVIFAGMIYTKYIKKRKYEDFDENDVLLKKKARNTNIL